MAAVRSIPRSREHSFTLTVRSAGARVGVCTPSMPTLSIVRACLCHRRADDVDGNADRPLIGAGRVEEDILCVDRHPCPFAVDDRGEREDVVVLVHD